MSLGRSLVRLLIFAGCIALYDVYLKGIYVGWLTRKGQVYGIGPALLMYSLVGVAAWVLGIVATRRMAAD